MPSNLEIIGINERSVLVTPNLYKQNWLTPNNTTDNYSVLHTRAVSDTTTPIYGKGTGIFLDTTNGGGSYDINGNVDYAGSGRLNAITINTAQWSYGPATPYSVTNTRALSDTTTPIYGKGTGIFLDTANGGGSYDINGNQTNFPGSGRVPLMNYNYAIWTFGPNNNYVTTHPHALRPPIIPTASDILGAGDVHGKGNSNSTVLNFASEFVLDAHTDYKGGSWDDIISRDRSIQTFSNLYWVNVNQPSDQTNWYTVSHANALAPPSPLPTAADLLISEGGNGDVKGKGTLSSTLLDISNEFVLPAHTNYGGGSWDDIISRQRSMFNFGNVYWVSSSEYNMNHPNAKADGDVHGKGTNDSTLLSNSNEFVLPAHTNYAGGSSDDIAARNSNITNPNNLYKVDVTQPTSTTNWYTMSNSNALATGDDKGKGTNDGIAIDGTYAAHQNYAGGSNTDINGDQVKFPGSGRNASNSTNSTTNLTNKPFGYGFNAGQGYTAPICVDAANTVNVGSVYYV